MVLDAYSLMRISIMCPHKLILNTFLGFLITTIAKTRYSELSDSIS